MATQTLSVLTHPSFPQVFKAAIEQELRRVDLVRCCFSDPHCDCKSVATVHDRKSEQEFCLRHFQAVRRG